MAAANLGWLASNRQRVACYANKKAGRLRPAPSSPGHVVARPGQGWQWWLIAYQHLASGLALHLRHHRLGKVGLGLTTGGQALPQLVAQGPQCFDTGDNAELFGEWW